MSIAFDRIRRLVKNGDWRASDHALQRLSKHRIIASDLADGIGLGSVIESYPEYHAGPCVLILQADRSGPVHALWGLEAGTDQPALLVTAYRPDPERWNEDNRTRKR